MLKGDLPLHSSYWHYYCLLDCSFTKTMWLDYLRHRLPCLLGWAGPVGRACRDRGWASCSTLGRQEVLAAWGLEACIWRLGRCFDCWNEWWCLYWKVGSQQMPTACQQYPRWLVAPIRVATAANGAGHLIRTDASRSKCCLDLAPIITSWSTYMPGDLHS